MNTIETLSRRAERLSQENLLSREGEEKVTFAMARERLVSFGFSFVCFPRDVKRSDSLPAFARWILRKELLDGNFAHLTVENLLKDGEVFRSELGIWSTRALDDQNRWCRVVFPPSIPFSALQQARKRILEVEETIGKRAERIELWGEALYVPVPRDPLFVALLRYGTDSLFVPVAQFKPTAAEMEFFVANF